MERWQEVQRLAQEIANEAGHRAIDTRQSPPEAADLKAALAAVRRLASLHEEMGAGRRS